VAREETSIQKSIVDVLRLCGVTVLHTSAFSVRGPVGSAKGVPDLLCWVEDSPGLIWGLEVKTPKGRPTPEQREYSSKGAYSIVRSIEDAIEASKKVLGKYAPESPSLKKLGRLGTP
jgi:hypothetical protein